MDGFPITIQAPRAQSAWLKWFLDHLVSFDDIVLKDVGADTGYESGTVLGKITVGSQTVGAATPGAGNTGNGVFTEANPAADPAAMAGTWKVVFIGAATNAGFFSVLRPDGTVDGYGKVGTAYTGGIKFTIADGATDFVVEDSFTVAVSYAAGSGKYVIMDPAATDGSQNFGAILGERVFIPNGSDVDALGVLRDAVILSDPLIWKAGVTNDQIAAALAQANAVRIWAKNTA